MHPGSSELHIAMAQCTHCQMPPQKRMRLGGYEALRRLDSFEHGAFAQSEDMDMADSAPSAMLSPNWMQPTPMACDQSQGFVHPSAASNDDLYGR